MARNNLCSQSRISPPHISCSHTKGWLVNHDASRKSRLPKSWPKSTESSVEINRIMHATSNKLWCNPTENTNGVHLGKPHPTVFLLIMTLHVKAEHCMIAFVRYIILFNQDASWVKKQNVSIASLTIQNTELCIVHNSCSASPYHNSSKGLRDHDRKQHYHAVQSIPRIRCQGGRSSAPTSTVSRRAA